MPHHPTHPPRGPGERVAYLRDQLDDQQRQYAHRRRRDKRKAFTLQMATVTLSAAITVLLGVRVAAPAQQLLANIALALGATTTVLAATEAFFRHRNLWVLRTVTVRQLEQLRRRVDYHLAGLDDQQVPPELVDGYLAQLNEVVDADQQAWLRLRSEAPPGEPDLAGPAGAPRGLPAVEAPPASTPQ